MHTTTFSSLTLNHDGDFKGGMYAKSGDVEIIITEHTIEEAINSELNSEYIALSGPDHGYYDRDVVINGDEKLVADRDRVAATISVKRADLEQILILRRTDELITFAEQFNGEGVPFRDAIGALDKMLIQAKALTNS